MTPFNFEEAEKKIQPAITPPTSFNFEEAEMKSRGRRFNFEEAEPRPAPQQPTPPQPPADSMPPMVTTEVGGVDITGFGSTLEEFQRQQSEPPKISFQELHTNDDYFKVIEDMQKALGKSGLREGQSRESYVKDFMDGRRFTEINTFLGAVPELAKIRNLPEAEQRKIAEGRRLYEETAGVFEQGGQPGFRPYWDAIFAIATDPLNYVGFGAAKLTQVGGSQLLKFGAGPATQPASRTQIIGAGVGAEGVLTGGADVIQQRLEQQTSRLLGDDVEDLNKTRVALMTAFGGLFGFVEGRYVADAAKRVPGQKLNKALEKRNIVSRSLDDKPTAAEKVISDALRDNMDEVVKQYVSIAGRETLEAIDPATAVTNAVVQKELVERANRLVTRIIEVDPSFAMKPNEQISDVVNRVFSRMETIDDAVLEQAIRSAGLTPDQFANATKVSVSDAARILQTNSATSKAFNRLREIDPGFNQRIEELYGAPDPTITKMSLGRKAYDVALQVEKEGKIVMTSGVDTTARNALGTTTAMANKTAAEMIEGTVYSIGHAVRVAREGGPVIETLKKDFADTIHDAFDVWAYMVQKGLATDMTEVLLQHNPSLQNKMLSALQEADIRQVSAFSRFANTLNVHMDGYFRRAIFTASVEKQLRRVGIDLYEDVILKNKMVPPEILTRAVDDSLNMTFSRAPRQYPKEGRTLTQEVESGAASIISGLERFPGHTVIVAPFLRFMGNAISYQYRYSPFGALEGRREMAEGLRLIEAGQIEQGELLVRQGRLKNVEALMGTAFIMAGYNYRMENPDTKWNEVKLDDGTVVDMKYIFPVAPYLAMGEILARAEQGVSYMANDALEGILGMRVPEGHSNLIRLIQSIGSDEKDVSRTAETIGKHVGEFFGRYTQPFVFKQIFDAVNMVREEGTMARDARVIEEREDLPSWLRPTVRGATAASQQLQSRLPIVKEQLPEAVRPLRETTPTQEGELFNRMIGVRQTPITPVDRELNRLGINAFRIYGSMSGDRQYDRLFVENANNIVLPYLQQIVEQGPNPNLSVAEQRQGLLNNLKPMIQTARQLTQEQMKARDFNRVSKMRFERLPREQRQIINQRYAQDHDGKTMDQNNDYGKLDAYLPILDALGYALGGLVRQGVKEAAQGAGTSQRRSIRDIVRERSVQQQTDEAIPPVAPQETVVPTQATPAPATPPVAPVSSPYNFPNKAFTDAEYAAAERQMIADMGDIVNSWKVSDPETFANTLHAYTARSKGLKAAEMPPAPYRFEVADDIIEAAEEIATPMVRRVPEEDLAPLVISDRAVKGSLKNISNPVDRDDILAQIMEVRQDSFVDLRSNKALQGIEDKVIGVTQGDFRFAKGREVNVNSAKDVAEFKKMAKTAQKRLETLREKHKDVPPIVLYHGSKSPRGAETIRTRGFADPRTLDRSGPSHTELDVSILSFTKDLNLPFRSGSFGGQSPERFVSVEMPYADYVFSRVNMPQLAYDQKNLNVIARSISGSPTDVRPLGLPRASMFETEDSIVEATKLTRARGSLLLPDDDITARVTQFQPIQKRREAAFKELDTAQERFLKDNSIKNANDVYRSVRNYTKTLFESARMVSTKTGLGQQFEVGVTNMPILAETMQNAATVLRQQGSTERAELLDKLARSKRRMNTLDPAETREIQRSRQELLDTIPKMNKGGLVARKRG